MEASLGLTTEIGQGQTMAFVVGANLEHRWLPTFSTYVRPSVWLFHFYDPTYHVGAGVRLSWPPRRGIAVAGLGLSGGTHRAYAEEVTHRWDLALFLEASLGVTIPTGTPLFFRLEAAYRRLLNTGGYGCTPPVTGFCDVIDDLGWNFWSLDVGAGVRF